MDASASIEECGFQDPQIGCPTLTTDEYVIHWWLRKQSLLINTRKPLTESPLHLTKQFFILILRSILSLWPVLKVEIDEKVDERPRTVVVSIKDECWWNILPNINFIFLL